MACGTGVSNGTDRSLMALEGATCGIYVLKSRVLPYIKRTSDFRDKEIICGTV